MAKPTNKFARKARRRRVAELLMQRLTYAEMIKVLNAEGLPTSSATLASDIRKLNKKAPSLKDTVSELINDYKALGERMIEDVMPSDIEPAQRVKLKLSMDDRVVKMMGGIESLTPEQASAVKEWVNARESADANLARILGGEDAQSE